MKTRRPAKELNADATTLSYAAHPPAIKEPPGVRRERLVETAALAVLLALIPLRAVIGETHTFEVPRFLRHLDAPVGAQPASTLFIVGLIAVLAALVVCARRYLSARPFHWTGGELGAVVLLVAGILSAARAGQKHLASIGVLDFLAMVLYLLALRQLLNRPWRVRLTLAVVLATGAMMITKCAYQYYVELPATIELYEQQKAELLQEEGAPAPGTRASGFRHDFEKRLMARTLTGYYAHPNLLGSHLILFILAASAVISSRIRERQAVWTLLLPAAIAATGFVALYATQSKGAIAACGIGLVLWFLGHAFGKTIARRPRRVLIVLWLAAVIGAGALVLTLQAKPDALGRSILFRQMYWQGAWKMIADENLLGVGANNFGRHFTRYKSVECPEEVESPHSWIVQFAAEWGVLGLVGILLLLAGISRTLAQPSVISGADVADGVDKSKAGRTPIGSSQIAGSIILWCGGVGAIIFLWWLSVLAGSPPAYVAEILLVGAIPWTFAFVLLAFESRGSTWISDEALGPLLPGLCAGLIAFLLHTGIDLALFAGGPATTIFALVAVALAVKQMPKPAENLEGPAESSRKGAQPTAAKRPRPALGLTLAIVSLTAFVAYLGLHVRPAARLSAALQLARAERGPASWEAYAASAGYHAYHAGIEAYPWDGTASNELIEQLIPRVATIEHVDRIMPHAHEFHRRDLHNPLAFSHLAALYRQRYHLGHDLADFRRAIDTYRKCVAAYPASPDRRVYLANLLEQYASITGDPDVRVEAAHQLQTALDLDAGRIYVSKPNRFTSEQRQVLSDRIQRLEDAS